MGDGETERKEKKRGREKLGVKHIERERERELAFQERQGD